MNLQENINRIQEMMRIINEESKNESFIEKTLKLDGFYDFEISYDNSYYNGNGPLTHEMIMYFIGKDGNYVRYDSGNVKSVKLYFRVRGNEPYLVDMDVLPGSFFRKIPPHIYEKFFEEKGSKVLKSYSKHKGGFDNWV
jgi:hypothetical protein